MPSTREQTDSVVFTKVTGKPELAVATQVLLPSTRIDVGVQDRVMVWSILLTAMALVTCDAGL